MGPLEGVAILVAVWFSVQCTVQFLGEQCDADGDAIFGRINVSLRALLLSH